MRQLQITRSGGARFAAASSGSESARCAHRRGTSNGDRLHRGGAQGAIARPTCPPQRVHSPSMPIRVTGGARRGPASAAAAEDGDRAGRLLLVPVGVPGRRRRGAACPVPAPRIDRQRQAGDCASFDRSNAAEPVRDGALRQRRRPRFTVLQVIDGDGSCRDVAGATRSTISTEGNTRREVCMGPKDVDPARRSTSPRSGTA